jgi:hypothetical protein
VTTKKVEAPTAHNSADPIRNFTLSVDERIRALTIGAPAWAIRKRKIEDAEHQWVATLVALREKLESRGTPRSEIDETLRAKAAAFDYRRVNELIALHNRWYPVEANLRIDPKSGGYLVYGRPWLPETPFTPDRILKQVS